MCTGAYRCAGHHHAPPLVRLLMQLSVEDVAARRHVVLDLVCVNRLYRDSTSGATSRIRQTIL